MSHRYTGRTVSHLADESGSTAAWEVRSSAFVYPPPSYGTDILKRELLPEECAGRRTYIDVRAVPLHDKDIPNPERVIVSAIRALFEVVGGQIARPMLELWREHQVATFVTDLGHFWLSYAPASDEERLMLETAIRETYPSGLPYAGL